MTVLHGHVKCGNSNQERAALLSTCQLVYSPSCALALIGTREQVQPCAVLQHDRTRGLQELTDIHRIIAILDNDERA